MVSENLMNEFMREAFLGGITGAALALGILLAIFLILAFYVYFALTWSTIARKLNYKNNWLAWIPVANFAMILQLGGFHWAWIFLAIIPILGWIPLIVLLVIATWKIFERRNYPGWFSISMIIPKIGFILYLVAIGFVAWSDKGKSIIRETPKRKATTKKKKR